MSKQKSTYEKRKEILESPYKNGVRSIDGSGTLAIRAMTEEEIAFLDKFNNEFGCANISYENPGLHAELVNKNILEIENINLLINQLKIQLKSFKSSRLFKGQEKINHINSKKDIQRQISELELKLKELDVIKDIRHDNYARSCDPLNFKNYHTNFLDLSFNSKLPYKNNGKDVYQSESEIIYNLEEKEIIKT